MNLGKCFLIISCLLGFAISGHAQGPGLASSAKIVDPFSLTPDNLGVISNSVNLFTGDLTLPLDLVSVPGRDGTGIKVSIVYSSNNIENLSSAWNLAVPTSILGLGWSMPISQITVNNNQTASLEDDVYYLQENQTSTKLICIGINSGVRSYVTQLYSNRIITYTPSTERWVITNEDGSKLTYGVQDNAIQWVATWGNWIGDSNQAPTSRKSVAWNLLQMITVWGDYVNYTYSKTENLVGNGGGSLFQTEASYLSSIVDSFGHEVDFVYKTKLAEEFMEPHTEQAEPDAFQERYERKYLDKILVKGDGTQYYEIDLRYTFYSAGPIVGYNTYGPSIYGNNTKRLLSSITKVASTGLQVPVMSFGYQQSGPMVGALNVITTATGGTVSFEYSAGVSIAHPSTSVVSSAPSGYAEPQIHIEDDYTLVTWRQQVNGKFSSSGQPIQVLAYSWEGEWKQADLTGPLPYNSVKSDSAGTQDISVSTQDNFFAMLMPDLANTNYYYVYIWQKVEGVVGSWRFFSDHLLFTRGSTPNQLFTGHDFAAVTDNNGNIFRYTRALSGTVGGPYSDWTKSQIVETADVHYITAANNYIISHDAVTGYINFYYLDESKTWQKPATTIPSLQNSGTPYWYASNTHAVVFPSGQDGYIYQWDNSYITFNKIDKGINYSSYFPTAYLTESVFGIQTSGGRKTDPARSLRFNGVDWIDSGEIMAIAPAWEWTAFGNDIFMAIKGDDTMSLLLFDPNTNAWSTTNQPWPGSLAAGPTYFIFGGMMSIAPGGSTFSQLTSSSPFSAASVTYASPNFFWNNGNIFYVKNNEVVGITPLSVFSPYIYCYGDLSSGGWDQTSTTYAGEWVGLTGNTSIALVPNGAGTQLWSTTSLTLVRVDASTQNTASFMDYPVDKVTMNDGTRNYYTSFSYEPSTAITDESRTTAQYNKVTTIKGSASTSLASATYGYTQTYYFNGLPETEVGDTFPNGNYNWQGTVPNNYVQISNGGTLSSNNSYKYLEGQIYRTQLFNAANSLQSETDVSYQVNVLAYNGVNKVGLVYLPLRVATSLTQDGVARTSNQTYNSLGQIALQSVFTAPNVENVTTTYTYAWQVYPNSAQAKNMLSQVFQVTKNVNGQDIQSSVTRYQENFSCTTCFSGGIPAAYDYYSWHGTTAAVSSISPNVTVTPAPEWVFEGMVSQRDYYNGVETEIKSKGGQIAARVWDNTRRSVLASVSNSPVALVAYSSFEDASTGGWTFLNGSAVQGAAKTGNYYYNLGSSGIVKGGLNPPDKYIFSFWANTNGGAVNISGISGAQNLGNLTGWTFFQYSITNVSSISIGINGTTPVAIDEVSIIPVNSQITTSTFHPLFGVTSKTDLKYQTSYFLYDGVGRMLDVEDDKGNIRKNAIYNLEK